MWIKLQKISYRNYTWPFLITVNLLFTIFTYWSLPKHVTDYANKATDICTSTHIRDVFLKALEPKFWYLDITIGITILALIWYLRYSELGLKINQINTKFPLTISIGVLLIIFISFLTKNCW